MSFDEIHEQSTIRVEGPAPLCPKHQCAMDRAGFTALIGNKPPADFICPRCSDELIAQADAARFAQRGVDERRDQARRKQEEFEARVGSAAIPARYRDFSFDTFPAEPNTKAAIVCQKFRSYANSFHSMRARGVSALLIGGTGAGKTGLACSVANRILLDGFTAAFMSAYSAVRHQRDAWGRRDKTERAALDDLLRPDLLILDELGTSASSEGEMALLYEVINGRYSAQLPTFLLTNLPMEDYKLAGADRPGLRTYLGPRVIDRFRDDGFTIAFDWPSLRGAHS
ncbi:MAG: ATP-binding protein [Lysobacter sp.]